MPSAYTSSRSERSTTSFRRLRERLPSGDPEVDSADPDQVLAPLSGVRW